MNTSWLEISQMPVAEQAYQNAKASGADERTKAQLFAEYEAKQAAENAACGTSYRARR